MLSIGFHRNEFNKLKGDINYATDYKYINIFEY